MTKTKTKTSGTANKTTPIVQEDDDTLCETTDDKKNATIDDDTSTETTEGEAAEEVVEESTPNVLAETTPTMSGLERARRRIRMVAQSMRKHCAVILGDPGWGKSTLVTSIMGEYKIEFVAMSGLTTARELFEKLKQAKDKGKFLIIDDCGTALDSVALEILKTASAATAGDNKRRVCWHSYWSSKFGEDEFIFRGKIIIITNQLPDKPELKAFLSRCGVVNIVTDDEERRRLIEEAAADTDRYPDQNVAVRVSRFLLKKWEKGQIMRSSVNYRSLADAYETAIMEPMCWKAMLLEDLCSCITDEELVIKLNDSKKPVKEQLQEYELKAHYKSRSKFYELRSKCGFARS